jgi:hypothetical protein
MQLEQIILSNAKSNHVLLRKSSADVPEFDPSAVDYSMLKEDRKYLIQWEFAAGPEIAMVLNEKVNLSDIFLHFRIDVLLSSHIAQFELPAVRYLETSTVFNVDAAHCSQGTLFRLTSFDAAGHVVSALDVWSAFNEAKGPWSEFGDCALRLYGGKLDSSSVAVVSDRDKGLRGGFHDKLVSASSRHCHKHLKADVIKLCGADQGTIFDKIAFATTASSFDAAFAQGNNRLQAMLGKMAKADYSNLHNAADLRGRTASQVMCYFQWVNVVLLVG